MLQECKLKVRNARKTYGAVVALDDTSLDMQAGEFLTLLGPSGSGKTTLLMAIAGLNSPDSGEIWIDGRQATYLPAFRREIGMVFQNYALFPHMTIYENIAFPLRMRRMRHAQIRDRVQRVLDTVRLGHVAQRMPQELSGGQQQRIALARCFVYEPSIILMDEPLAALDKKLRDALQLEIRRLHQELGMTVLYVTHDQEEAMTMSDRICLMNDARVEQIGSPDDLYFRPRSVFAADFLGESNLLAVTAHGMADGVAQLALAEGTVLRASAYEAPEPGKPMTLMVRPECVRMLRDGETADNVVTGTVSESILTGHVTKSYITLADGKSTVKVTQLTRERQCRMPKGQSVRLGWQAGQSVVLPAQGRA